MELCYKVSYMQNEMDSFFLSCISPCCLYIRSHILLWNVKDQFSQTGWIGTLLFVSFQIKIWNVFNIELITGRFNNVSGKHRGGALPHIVSQYIASQEPLVCNFLVDLECQCLGRCWGRGLVPERQVNPSLTPLHKAWSPCLFPKFWLPFSLPSHSLGPKNVVCVCVCDFVPRRVGLHIAKYILCQFYSCLPPI